MAGAETPVMRQYREIKEQHPGALVMFRMGDFYELFGEDAQTAAGILQITLTKRRTSKPDDPGIPMCGVPYHAAEGYIGKLLEQGHRVALVEQTETPEEARRARGSGALVNRAVARLFTPGTLTEEAYLGRQARYLVAVHTVRGGGAFAVAWLDLAGGRCGLESCANDTRLSEVLDRLPVGELLVDSASMAVVTRARGALAPQGVVREEATMFNAQRAEETIKRAYGVAQLAGLGLNDAASITALGALLAYAELTQVGKLPPLTAPAQNTNGAAQFMAIDPATRRSLELSEVFCARDASGKANTLLDVLDRSQTGAGGRLLARWVNEPLLDVAQIGDRQAAVAALVQLNAVRQQLRSLLKDTGDVARCTSRLLLGRGSPRDFAVLRQTGQALPGLMDVVRQAGAGLLTSQGALLGGLEPLTALLERALKEETAESPLPAVMRDGGFIRPGFDAELDGFRELVEHGNDKLAALERHEAETSGIAGLKVRYNQVWGYFFELSKAQADQGRVPGHFIHRQTTTGTHRYSTEGLMTLERDLGNAGSNALRRECFLFEQLVAEVKRHSVALLDAAMGLATLDALASMAEVAARQGWVRPTVDTSCAFRIEGGKHPVVAARVADFIANSCDLGPKNGDGMGQTWLLTGPNMAGKSTFLRQNALLAILAQMGSFVPAVSAHIGVCDAVFSRIGAADNLAAGQSTFMVEMVETAQILNRATRRSLVILDELGRGTATYDGLAIAWACMEQLAGQTGCRTLFATHYHELTTLAETLPAISAHQVAVKEWQGEIVFLHEVKPGAAAGSFGVQVAKLAGVPQPVVQRAAALLKSFERTAAGNKSKSGIGVAKVADLGLFSAPLQAPAPVMTPSAVEEGIRALDVDALTPRQALDELYRLKGLVQ